jgi:hypothetical protein
MPIFNPSFCLRITLVCILLDASYADHLVLTENTRLTGTLRSIDEKGIIELATDIAPKSILLKPGVVQKVEFSSPATIDGLNEKELAVTTPDAGRFVIARAALKSMQLGFLQQKTIYHGPKSHKEWKSAGNESGSWQFSNNSLTADGPAVASSKFDVSSQFTLKFTLKWKTDPEFKIFFADPLTPNINPVDRYYMEFNTSGFVINREASQGKQFHSVILLPRCTPEQYPENQLVVEIRVDRKNSRIELLLNDEPETKGVDPTGGPPNGNGISLVSLSPIGFEQVISNIEILEFDNSKASHLAEERENPKSDSLISRHEDRWSGSLLGIRQTAEGSILTFKSDFQEDPLELNEDEVSTIFFAQSEVVSERGGDYALRLSGNGLLKVSSCSFSNDFITAQHQLLGPIKINRSRVTALEWMPSEAVVKPQKIETVK